MNTVCNQDATTLALIYNYEATHSISMMLKHSQIKDFAEEINLNLQHLGKTDRVQAHGSPVHH